MQGEVGGERDDLPAGCGIQGTLAGIMAVETLPAPRHSGCDGGINSELEVGVLPSMSVPAYLPSAPLPIDHAVT